MDASIFFRFGEVVDTVRPVDAAGGIEDLLAGNAFGLGSTNMPPIVDGVISPARSFGGAAGQHGLQGRDLVPGSTLHNRDVSVQAILTWDRTLASGANPGCIIARGIGTSAAEYVAYALEIRLVNAANQIGEVRWLWMDSAGVLKTQIGGQFQASDDFVMITATRRWVSSTEVVLRYYLADELLSEVISVDGSIGGGTTALTTVGCRFVGAGFTRWYGGKIDEVRVLPRVIEREEVEATWRRITVLQPAGGALLRELHDPGFPMSADPDSRVQRETRMWGDGLGYATAQSDNMRDNIMPDRAYGEPLAQWERITARPPKPSDSVEERRARVVSKLAQRAGVSIPGVKATLEELVDTDPANLEIIAFDQTTLDQYAALNDLRWQYEPAARFTIASNALRVQNVGAAATFTGAVRDWYWARMSLTGERSNNGRDVCVFAKIIPTATGNGTDTGIAVGDTVTGNFFLFGYSKPTGGGNMEFRSEAFVAWASQGVVVHGNVAALPTVYLAFRAQPPGILGGTRKFTVLWSTVSADGPYTTVADVDSGSSGPLFWAYLYHRTLSGTPTIDFSFDDVRVRTPYGTRPFHWYVYRNPALPGKPDIAAADKAIRELGHAHTKGALVTAKIALCDDANSLCDSTPMGAI